LSNWVSQNETPGAVEAYRRTTGGNANAHLNLDIARIVEILNVDISSEEQSAGVADPARAEYPALARTLRARRDNLLGTISALQQRLI